MDVESQMTRIRFLLVSGLALTGIAALLVTGWACTPPYPPHPGYVSMPARQKGSVDLGLMAGGFYAGVSGGGAQIKVEPYLLPALSLPIDAMGGGTSFGGGGALRVGLRYRALPLLSVGGGLGGGFYGISHWGSTGALHVDLELALGRRWRVVGLSFALRPTFDVIFGWFLVPAHFSLAIYPLGRLAITLHVMGGPFTEMEPHPYASGWIGGGVGFDLHF